MIEQVYHVFRTVVLRLREEILIVEHMFNSLLRVSHVHGYRGLAKRDVC